MRKADNVSASGKPTRRRFIIRASAGAAVIAALDSAQLFPAAQAATVTIAARGPQPVPVTLLINGTPHTLDIEPRVTLLDALRERLALTGTKKGCDQGTCGACTVLLDGKRVNSCLTLAIMSQGRAITTIEGLAHGDALHPMQAAFLEHDGFQCGYCTPGQILSAVALVAEGRPTDATGVREWMSGNICRCGAYANIVAAVQSVAGGQA
jgi:xanthine dehydrogenase YagT iron-sulfur-binding subunit